MHSIANNLTITIPNSRFLRLWLLAGCLGSFTIIYFLSLALWAKGTLALLILGYTLYLYTDKVQCSLNSSCVKIQLLKSMEWLLTTQQNSVHAATLRADTFVTSWLIILRYQYVRENGVISIPLFSHETDPNLWRKLNIYLRWKVPLHLKEKLL